MSERLLNLVVVPTFCIGNNGHIAKDIARSFFEMFQAQCTKLKFSVTFFCLCSTLFAVSLRQIIVLFCCRER